MLSYANVVSTLCLFLLLGGGAYAASQLPKNSVGPKQLKRGAVTTAKIRDRAVKLRKLHGSAINRLRGARGPRGVPGSQGQPGDPAAIGVGVVGTANLAPTIPATRVTHDEDQIIESDELTTLEFNRERYDTAGLHSPATNSRLIAPVRGVYVITANVEWGLEVAGEAVGVRTLVLARNGNAPIAIDRESSSDFDGAGGAENIAQTIATQTLLDGGDYVGVQVHHTQPAELTIASFFDSPALELSPEFAMTWLAPGPPG